MRDPNLLDQQKIRTFFNVAPSPGCKGASVEVIMWKPSRAELDRKVKKATSEGGSKVFPASFVWAARDGLTLCLLDRKGIEFGLRHQPEDWERAWDALSLGASRLNGDAAFFALGEIQQCIRKGGLRKRGEHGASRKGGIEEMEKSELFIAVGLARDVVERPRLASVREALAQPDVLLPAAFLRRKQELHDDTDKRGRKVGERELEKDGAKKLRDAEWSARPKTPKT